MTETDYSAALVSKPFWYLETRETAKHLSSGLSRSEIRELAVKENIYQCKAEYRALEVYQATTRRLAALPADLIKQIAEGDFATGKALTVVAIMKTDRLFCEFMSEVFYAKLRLGDYVINPNDLTSFFAYKSGQSEKVAGWSEYSVRKLKSTYMKILSDAGFVIQDAQSWKILLPLLPASVKRVFLDNGMKHYLTAITGEIL